MQVTKEQLTRISDAWGELAFMALELLERTALGGGECQQERCADPRQNHGSTQTRGSGPACGDVRVANARKGDG